MKNDLPLKDIVILDFSWVIAGPFATRMLADLGAQVIKVTSRNIDVTRPAALRVGNEDFREEAGWLYNDLNHGKKNISLNLKSEMGRQIMEELVAKSDLVVCNYGKGAFHKLGLTYEELSKIKKDIIVVNASGLGDDGPYSGFVTYAPVLQALTGIANLVGYEDETLPLEEYAPVADYIGGIAIANYLLAALEWRRKTGEGQFIDLSQGECSAIYLGPALLDMQSNNKKSGALLGNRDWAGRGAPHNVYRCAGDRWCVIEVFTEEEWKNFCKVADPHGVWSADPRFAALPLRLQNAEALDAFVEQWTLQCTADEVGDLLQAVGVAAAPVQSARDCLTRDKHLQARGFYREMPFAPSDRRPEKFMVTGVQPHLADVEYPHTVSPAVCNGYDNAAVLTEFLGKTQEWIETAEKGGAFG